ncbi:glycoside hydrolase family 16 protein [Frankia sp. AgB32]|uniref:glycoside hydrolase family 16 protein n=1 Tax=Frankia sp. AgB32 TaxID=631119 RepID=UPI00201091D7|nr:glycoside hydrolase family 16 protein [Frankia sp. AgB32]MCK9893714.1 glycoside hydrolase family 16 protein [Frankia sp. AgB32]
MTETRRGARRRTAAGRPRHVALAAAALLVGACSSTAVDTSSGSAGRSTAAPSAAAAPGSAPAGSAAAASGSTAAKAPGSTTPNAASPGTSPRATSLGPRSGPGTTGWVDRGPAGAGSWPVPPTGSSRAPLSSGAGRAPSAGAAAPATAPAATGGGAATGIVTGTLVQADDFDGSAIDTRKWFVYNSPNSGFARVPEAVSVGGGFLKITGGYNSAGKDVSGGVSSLVHQAYGRWEARIRVERGAGYSAVALLWPQSEKWPNDGEIDLVEVKQGDRQSATAAVHNGPNNDIIETPTAMVADFTAWHTVAVEWLPDRLTYFLDGRAVLNVKPGYSRDGAPTIPSTSEMHMALQLDTGCHDGIPCRTSSTPAKVSMYVDWIRTYAYRG